MSTKGYFGRVLAPDSRKRFNHSQSDKTFEMSTDLLGGSYEIIISPFTLEARSLRIKHGLPPRIYNQIFVLGFLSSERFCFLFSSTFCMVRYSDVHALYVLSLFIYLSCHFRF